MATSAARTVLITGTSGGVGLTTAVHLAQHGWQVFGTVRNDQAAARLRAQSPNLTPVHCELSDPASIRACAKEVGEEAGGRLNALVNNAAMQCNMPLELVPDQAASDVYATNVLAPLRLVRECLPMLRATRGRVVNVGSVVPRLAAPGAGIYSSSKAALQVLTSNLWLELQPWKIHVGYIEAGFIDTPMLPRAREDYEEVTRNLPPELEAYRPMFNPDTLDQLAVLPPADAADLAKMIEDELTRKRPHRHRWFGRDARAVGVLTKIVPSSLLERAMVRFVFSAGK